MISVVKDKEEPGISLVQLPIPAPSSDQVLVKVDTVGICGSDLHVYEWIPEYYWIKPHMPAVLGHEITGTIVEPRPDGSGPRVGQRVVVRPAITCGECEPCQRGESQRCANRLRMGYEAPGGLAEYMVAPSKNVYAIPAGVSRESAALTEPLTVAIHAVKKLDVRPGSKAAVVGPGAIGLLALQLLKARGAGEVLMIGTEFDATGGGLTLADELGGRGLINTEASTEAGTCDVVIVAAGARQALDQAFELVAKGGEICVIGLGIGSQQVDVDRLVRSEVTLTGSFGSVQGDWLDALNLLDSGLVRGGGIVSHWLALGDVEVGFEKLVAHEARKVILQPSGGGAQ